MGSPLRKLGREVAGALSGIPVPAAAATVVGSALLVLAHHQGSTAFYRAHLSRFFAEHTFAGVYPYLYWFAAAFICYFTLPLLAARLTPGIQVRSTGIGLGDHKAGFTTVALALLVFLPVVYLASRHPAFARHYPLCTAARDSWDAFLIYELGYAAYFIGWEYLFRGYLLFSLEPSIGKLAVFAQTMPFVIIHFGKPEAETFGSIVAGIFLGLLALRTRSFWYGALIHIVVALSMDLFAGWANLTKPAG